jgi:plasmid stabilization system protein ParE
MWIEEDNPDAAQRFLQTAREAFDRLGDFPETGPLARLRGKEFHGLRFLVLHPPFNKWIVFYRVGKMVEIIRVLYGTQDWRGEPDRFF